MEHIYKFMATGCYSGYLPVAPGTWGTLVGVVLFWFLGWLSPVVYIITVVAFIFFSIWAAERARRIFGGDDPPQIVIDEIAGYLVTMAFHKPAWVIIVIGFLLFRIFDIIKPWPVNWIDRRLSGGAGIVLDDVMAGVYANAALFILIAIASMLGINSLVK